MFLAFLLSLALEEPKTAQIDVRYENLSAEAQADFENAVAVWERCLVSDAPIKIVASSIKRGPTGFANHNSVRNKRYLPKRGVWYPTALASALRGRRVTEQDDMNVFLKEAGDGDNWHFSQDDPISEGKVDFINVAMHEIAHGLGVSSVIFVPWEGEPIASIGRPDEFVDFFEWSFPFREQDGTIQCAGADQWGNIVSGCDLLRREGAEVEIVENGQLALDAIERTPYDVLLLDMQMPICDGYTAARTLREKGSSIPIVAVTAHALPGDREKCLDAGCDDYMTKPVDASLLVEMCRRYGTGSASTTGSAA